MLAPSFFTRLSQGVMHPFGIIAYWWNRVFLDARIIIEVDGHVRHLYVSSKVQRFLARGTISFLVGCVAIIATSAYLTISSLEVRAINMRLVAAQKEIAKALSISANQDTNATLADNPLELANQISAQGVALKSLSAKVADDLNSINKAMLAGLDGAVDIHRERARNAGHGAGGRPVAIAARNNSEFEQQLEDYETLKQIYGALPVRMPINQEYTVTSGYGERNHPVTGHLDYHPGVDLVPLEDERANAVMAGVVERAGKDGAYGNSVILVHSERVRTRYAHLKDIQVSVGQQVKAGDALGIIGSTGMSTGRHLHYEVLLDGFPVNPVLASIFNHNNP
jgi:murein DD-endopeptidase MepM/ murein hydrolase activator NlpD